MSSKSTFFVSCSFILELVFPAHSNGLKITVIALCSNDILFAQTYTLDLTLDVHLAFTLPFPVKQHTEDLSSNYVNLSLRSSPPVPAIEPVKVYQFSISHCQKMFYQFSSPICTGISTRAALFKVVAVLSLRIYTFRTKNFAVLSSSSYQASSFTFLPVTSCPIQLYILVKFHSGHCVTVSSTALVGFPSSKLRIIFCFSSSIYPCITFTTPY